jgi:hypothetical protein
MIISRRNRTLCVDLFLLAALWFLPSLIHAQLSTQTKETQAGAQVSLRSMSATRVDRPPRLDGTLDDPMWEKASAIANFLQREPFEGQAPTEKTEVRVLYTRNEIYFGITCFDSNPRKVVATELRRDVAQELDDYFELIIDSAHDRRNAYVFQINPRAHSGTLS